MNADSEFMPIRTYGVAGTHIILRADASEAFQLHISERRFPAATQGYRQ